MNIKVIRTGTKKYIELKIGDAFILEGDVYMMTNQRDPDLQLGGINLAVRLSDGSMMSICRDTKVEIPKCQLIIEMGTN